MNPTATPAASWDALPLAADGRSRIEASAGTGKTWTISVLYLRLLLEQEFGPRQIVVTTFTDAAAEELRERIRSRLQWALQQAGAAPGANPGPDETWLRARWQAGSDARAADCNRLRLALAGLDQAPIGTLHGLCRRILADFPFECGTPFVPGELIDAGELHAELLADLWRRLGQADALDADGELLWAFGRDKLAEYLGKALQPGVQIHVPEEAGFADVLDVAEAAWLEGWINDSAFTRRNSGLRTRLLRLAAFIQGNRQDLNEAAVLVKELPKCLDESPDKHLREPTLSDPGLGRVQTFARDALSALDQLVNLPLARALAAAAAELRAEAAERLAARGQLTFDGLIERVHVALQAPGSVLAERLFEAWPVALVDEFQDTDGVQYGILDQVYRHGEEGKPRGRLVMIGDPKQAIYRFRGGDIDAYLRAASTATDALSLGVNHRSSPALVAGLNELYAHAGEVLSSDPAHRIAYQPVAAAPGRADVYTVAGQPCTRPLQVHYWPEPPDAAPERNRAALEGCANLVVELLSGDHHLEGKAVQPGDIAVLLPANHQVSTLRGLLQARGVPCVSSARDSVFGSDWARELQVVLHAVLHPRDEGALRAALATRLGGLDFAALCALDDDPEAWQAHALHYQELELLWRRQGVLAVIQALVHAASARLFALADSERALTDLRHLAELLQARSDALPGRELLLGWLAEQRAGSAAAGEAADERQLRIESDARRVALMTLHASKGLEFNIVLLPMMWANVQQTRDTIAVVHDAASGERVLALGSEALAQYRQHGQDERFRLLYVALTRARHACHLFALPPERKTGGNRKGPATDPERSALDCMLARLLARTDPETLSHVAWHTGDWCWPERRWRGAPSAAPERVARDLPPVPAFESRYSFTTLASGARNRVLEDEAADDEVPVTEPALVAIDDAEWAGDATLPEHPELLVLAPIAGREFGNAVHAVFEERDPAAPMVAQHKLVAAALRDAHVDLRGQSPADVAAVLAARVQATLDTPLLANDPSLTLGSLAPAAQRAEMEFDFVLDSVSLGALRAVCDFVPPGGPHTLRGFMNGKIDLVFEHAGRVHVLDYKSNRLGTRLADYAPDALAVAMDQHHYRFQALLYTVAVDRYLRARKPGYERARHLGEVFYLFMRATGIDPDAAPDAGIWAHRFDDALIAAVDAVFAGAREGEAA